MRALELQLMAIWRGGPRQRAVIALRDVEGFSAEDACEILGVTAVHQRVLLHRARSRVRAECERFYRGAA